MNVKNKLKNKLSTFKQSKKIPKSVNKKKNIRFPAVLELIVIILVGILIYSNSFTCSFHFDDNPNILENKTIQHIDDVKGWWNFSPTRKVAIFTFALNYYFNQFDVRYWHYFNLAVHLINACLVWWLTILLFNSPLLKVSALSRFKKDIAFFTALLFISHPDRKSTRLNSSHRT